MNKRIFLAEKKLPKCFRGGKLTNLLGERVLWCKLKNRRIWVRLVKSQQDDEVFYQFEFQRLFKGRIIFRYLPVNYTEIKQMLEMANKLNADYISELRGLK